MSGNNLDTLRERFNSLRALYVAEDPSVDNSEVEQLAVELEEYHQLQADRAEARIAKQYARGTLAFTDPTIFHDL